MDPEDGCASLSGRWRNSLSGRKIHLKSRVNRDNLNSATASGPTRQFATDSWNNQRPVGRYGDRPPRQGGLDEEDLPWRVDKVRQMSELVAVIDSSATETSPLRRLKLLAEFERSVLAEAKKGASASGADKRAALNWLRPIFANNTDYRVSTIAYRVVNHLMQTVGDVRLLLETDISRCLIAPLVDSTNYYAEIERVECLRLLTKLFKLHHTCLPHVKALLRSEKAFHDFAKHLLQALATVATGVERKGEKVDRLRLVALGFLAEMAVNERRLVMDVIGTQWLGKAIQLQAPSHRRSERDGAMDDGQRRITNTLLNVLCYWLDAAGTDGSGEKNKMAELFALIAEITAPLVELGFFQRPPGDSKPELVAFMSSQMEQSSQYLLYLMRQWSGLLAICSPKNPTSPLRVFAHLCVDSASSDVTKPLHPNTAKLFKLVVDGCCEFGARPYAHKELSSWEESLAFYAGMHLPDAYDSSLRRGFLVAEMETLVQSGMLFHDRRLDLLNHYRQLATDAAVTAGLPAALCRIALLRPNNPTSLKATLLLADLLRTTTAANSSPLDASFMSSDNWPLLAGRLEQLNRIHFKRQHSNPLVELDTISTFFLPIALARPSSFSGGHQQIDWESAVISQEKDSSHWSDLHSRLIWTTMAGNETTFGAVGGEQHSGPLTTDWQLVVQILSLLERSPAEIAQRRFTRDEKCRMLFTHIFLYFAPHNASLARYSIDATELRLQIHCGRKAFAMATRQAAWPHNDAYYERLITEWLAEFTPTSISATNRPQFDNRLLLTTESSRYFALLRAIAGVSHEPIERSGVYQHLLDIVRSDRSSPELIKVTLASLDYSCPDSDNGSRLPRLVLETALTAGKEVKLRKWATKFLSLLAGLNFAVIGTSTTNAQQRYEEEREIGEYAIKLAIRQLADPSRKVVKAATRVLLDWIQKYPRCLRTLYSFKLDQLGDESSHRLLEALCYADEILAAEHSERLDRTLLYWMRTFNAKYVQLVEARLNALLLGVKRKEASGGFARSSMERSHNPKSIRLPHHLYGSLAQHGTGQRLVLKHGSLNTATECLYRYRPHGNADRAENGIDVDVKAALFSTAQLISNLPQSIAPSMDGNRFSPRDINAALRAIMRLSDPQTPASSTIRGTAIWALRVLEEGGDYGRSRLEAIRRADAAFSRMRSSNSATENELHLSRDTIASSSMRSASEERIPLNRRNVAKVMRSKSVS